MLVFAYVALIASIHGFVPTHKKIFSQVGLSFALIAGASPANDIRDWVAVHTWASNLVEKFQPD